MKFATFLVLLGLGVSQAFFFNWQKRIRRLPIPDDAGEPLILTPYLSQNRNEEARKAAEVNYDAFQGVKSYSGYFTVDERFDSNLFFWFFPSANDYENDPVLLWLQGGPGAPSLYALFTENGPFFLDDDTLKLREYSWHKNHSVLYIDSPVGTGFSFTNGGLADNQTKVGEDLYQALVQFFTLFPEIQKNDFFVTGESYAGKYIPAIGYTIYKNNPTADVFINLKGLLIGNGLSDPINQLDYGDYVYQIGLVDSDTRDLLNDMKQQTISLINKGDYEGATEIMNGDMMWVIMGSSGITDIYNYENLAIEYLDEWQDYVQANLRSAIHVGNVVIGSGDVWGHLEADITKSVAPWVSELLSNYRVLIYNGQLDIIVAYPLTVNYLRNLNFSAAAEYKAAYRSLWVVDDDVAGYAKVAGNLTEVLVRNAGHMVPMDQPKWGYDLVYKFARNLTIGFL
ncbi:venom serine carboxypeptidase-like [Cylas formicarius]|uniref:venom serine carboxypeptidase-like n=1 Tax=Cylas formicarius TaxID=197179 RepID=UPI002958C4AC|nr:venom serine carboxypeptidase-like [Cylas formicarius]